MANNLPPHLTYEHSTALRARLFDLAAKFAREHDLNQQRVEAELGFICAHYAAVAGVLEKDKYAAWLAERNIP